MSSYQVTERAAREIFEIFLFSIERFGVNQAERYEQSLRDCFSLLAENPRLGRRSDSISPGLRRHEHGSHVILYQELADGIHVVGLVHKRALRGLKL